MVFHFRFFIVSHLYYNKFLGLCKGEAMPLFVYGVNMGFPILEGYEVVGKKAIALMKTKGYKVRALNIIYFEGVDTDLKTLNADRMNRWNDVRTIISDKGDVLMASLATTEPGNYYTYNRLNPNGAFRIAFGQHLEAWQLGKHHNQDALVQCGMLKGYRDNNEDGSRAGDILYAGDDFGVNQHTTANSATDQAPSEVGRWSAGCLVGAYPSTHYNSFMPICRAMGLAKFDSTIIDGTEFVKWQG